MHIVLLKATTLFYLVGALLYLYFVFTLNERSARIGRMLLLIGVIVVGWDTHDSYAYVGGTGTGIINPNPVG